MDQCLIFPFGYRGWLLCSYKIKGSCSPRPVRWGTVSFVVFSALGKLRKKIIPSRDNMEGAAIRIQDSIISPSPIKALQTELFKYDTVFREQPRQTSVLSLRPFRANWRFTLNLLCNAGYRHLTYRLSDGERAYIPNSAFSVKFIPQIFRPTGGVTKEGQQTSTKKRQFGPQPHQFIILFASISALPHPLALLSSIAPTSLCALILLSFNRSNHGSREAVASHQRMVR